MTLEIDVPNTTSVLRAIEHDSDAHIILLITSTFFFVATTITFLFPFFFTISTFFPLYCVPFIVSLRSAQIDISYCKTYPYTSMYCILLHYPLIHPLGLHCYYQRMDDMHHYFRLSDWEMS